MGFYHHGEAAKGTGARGAREQLSDPKPGDIRCLLKNEAGEEQGQPCRRWMAQALLYCPKLWERDDEK